LSLGALAAFSVGPTASLADGTATASSTTGREPPASTEEHSLSLSEGSEGNQVERLQRALGNVKVDGIFGPETEAAVRSFQSSAGLSADGIVGPATSSALSMGSSTLTAGVPHDASFTSSTAAGSESASTSSTSASSGEAAAGETSGEGEASPGAVARLQGALHLPADGIFGPETEAAVRRLQARHGLSVDGVVGPATWSVIDVSGEQTLTPPALVTESAQAEAGSVGEQADPSTAHAAQGSGGGTPTGAIKRLQAALRLPVDGEFGPETEAAIRRLQARHGLSVDGVVGPATWSVIGVSTERELKPPRDAIVSEGGDASSGVGSSSGSSGGESSGEGAGSGTIGRVIAAGDEIATRPYVYGGGHGSFQSSGYDCSGSVSYALHGGGLLSSPEDSTALESYGASGPGRHITIYANSEHAFMVVDGKRFDTVAQAETGTRWSSSMTSTSGYVARHPVGY
jgi:peptidoglycan hydrolase-like protein with peptidoglycan-binding domain